LLHLTGVWPSAVWLKRPGPGELLGAGGRFGWLGGSEAVANIPGRDQDRSGIARRGGRVRANAPDASGGNRHRGVRRTS